MGRDVGIAALDRDTGRLQLVQVIVVFINLDVFDLTS